MKHKGMLIFCGETHTCTIIYLIRTLMVILLTCHEVRVIFVLVFVVSMRILTYLFWSVKFERLLNNKVISFIPRIHNRFPRDNIATLKNDDYFFHSLSS